MSDLDIFLVHAPPNQVAKAEALYAIVSVDANGEGVCGVMTDMGWMPMVFILPHLIEPSLAALRVAASATGKHQQLRVLKFSQREVLKEIDTEQSK
jgi:hypothetical protein